MRILIADAYASWKAVCDDRLERMRRNEREINQILINAYGLSDEMDPEPEVEATLRCADLAREMKSLLSYFVGCAFGRYSLEEEGLILAGGPLSPDRYGAFQPVLDNVLPLSPQMDGDAAARLEAFLALSYGERTLEENLCFLAASLNLRGGAREALRTYFLKDFYRDHLKSYRKRPVYLLLESGREKAFSALFYLHRYESGFFKHVLEAYARPVLDGYRANALLGDASATKKASEMEAFIERLIPFVKNPPHVSLDAGVKANAALFQGLITHWP